MTEVALPAEPSLHDHDPASALRRRLERQFHECRVVRPFHRSRYDPGHRLEYAITGVSEPNPGRMIAEVERFVGGGFAGQVYRVKVIEVVPGEGPIAGLAAGSHYAIKILKPPSAFARVFRDFLYFLAYQGRFGAQVNPASVRVGVLWQKLIRRAAAARFGTENAVCDTYATFYDDTLHSFGEINEWIDGRIWKFEVDDRLFERWDFRGRPPADHNSPEYVHKKLFMKELVALLHEMGAPELARQYEWWTCKSQPNALKRLGTDSSPDQGLTAVDFRAGLALLPFLPMSPADVGLVFHGLARGRIVQFDRSDPARFRRFMDAHRHEFADLEPAIEELERQESAHWASLPDVTHHHVRLITDPRLRESIRRGTITGWRNLGWLDDDGAERLGRRPHLHGLLYLMSLIPVLGGFVLRVWGNAVTREHAGRCWTSFGYLWRAMRASRIEALIGWHRDGRTGDERTLRLVQRPVRYWLQRVFLGWLPPKWHRSLAEPKFAWSRVRETVGFFLHFLRYPAFRETWLLEQVREGREEGMLTEAEADRITHQVKDPYIQKYLRCLAVHLCTVPITHTLMLLAGAGVVVYCMAYRHLSWAQSLGYGAATAAVIQLLPISPGSIARGVFVIFLMIKERDFRNYAIAAPVSFIHLVGYLAFPLQMVNRNPALARFMAGRWAKQMVRIVPVFGERGGLLEHGVFDAFFNLPVSVHRRFRTDPGGSTAITVFATVVLIFWCLVGYVRIWEARQPRVRLENVEVASIVPYGETVGDLHWSLYGMRVRFSGRADPVDYPARKWDRSVTESDRVDAIVRRSFFGREYDGLQISRR
jgi:hypothetical protein